MDESFFVSPMQWRLSILKAYLDDETLTGAARQEALERQVQLVLKELNNELPQARQSTLNYITLLGFGYLIEEQSWVTQS